jgi:hypothetical protein
VRRLADERASVTVWTLGLCVQTNELPNQANAVWSL